MQTIHSFAILQISLYIKKQNEELYKDIYKLSHTFNIDWTTHMKGMYKNQSYLQVNIKNRLMQLCQYIFKYSIKKFSLCTISTWMLQTYMRPLKSEKVLSCIYVQGQCFIGSFQKLSWAEALHVPLACQLDIARLDGLCHKVYWFIRDHPYF